MILVDFAGIVCIVDSTNNKSCSLSHGQKIFKQLKYQGARMPGVTELAACRAGCEMSEICYAFDYIVENGEISCTHIYKPRVPNPEYMQTISSEHMRENNITHVEAFQCTLGNPMDFQFFFSFLLVWSLLL